MNDIPKTTEDLFTNNTKAELIAGSLFNHAVVVSSLKDSSGEAFPPEDCALELAKQNAAIRNGKMTEPEDMLFYQAKTLDALFLSLLQRSRANMGEYFDAADKYMRLALRAQNQCRATLETLAEIKNPKQPLIQNNIQANTAQYQQVQNGNVGMGDAASMDVSATTSASTSRTPAHGENSKQRNELMDDRRHDQTATTKLDYQAAEQLGLDTGASPAAGQADSAMAAVER